MTSISSPLLSRLNPYDYVTLHSLVWRWQFFLYAIALVICFVLSLEMRFIVDAKKIRLQMRNEREKKRILLIAIANENE